NLSINVPDWKIVSERLIAYPLLEDAPALTFDAITHEVSWNIDRDSIAYVESLAKSLAELHRITADDGRKSNLQIMTPSELRVEVGARSPLAKADVGVSEPLEYRCRRWLHKGPLGADYTCLIHGGLYAVHVLTSKVGKTSGIIDWFPAHM